MSSATISLSCPARQARTGECGSAAAPAWAVQGTTRTARTAETRVDLRQVIELDWKGKMVGARGFEPPASRSRTVRSTKLSYAPTFLRSFARRSRRYPRETNREDGEETAA